MTASDRQPQALLLDMDDTLADASRSYRRATIQTAELYGVSVGLGDIARAKAAGNANDDWELTWRLITRTGRSVSLAEVTARFEEIYQGTADRRGLKLDESLLCEAALLERLASRLPLGIVTGRPRADARFFLELHGLDRWFTAVVTMDDGPLKPDPTPVRLALSRLGVSYAWMVGDTPDDIRAARAAGCDALGVIAPADDPPTARAAILEAGALAVLGTLAELEGLLDARGIPSRRS